MLFLPSTALVTPRHSRREGIYRLCPPLTRKPQEVGTLLPGHVEPCPTHGETTVCAESMAAAVFITWKQGADGAGGMCCGGPTHGGRTCLGSPGRKATRRQL